MSLRISADEALKRGLIDEAAAKEIKAAAKSRLPKQLSSSVKPTKGVDAGDINLATAPQKILFEALCRRLPGRPQWEVKDLIPGRRYEADIFIAPDLVVEMDGFKFHRSKAAFQKDRLRQNLFTANGFRTFRAFAKQVNDPAQLEELVEMIALAAG